MPLGKAHASIPRMQMGFRRWSWPKLLGKKRLYKFSGKRNLCDRLVREEECSQASDSAGFQGAMCPCAELTEVGIVSKGWSHA